MTWHMQAVEAYLSKRIKDEAEVFREDQNAQAKPSSRAPHFHTPSGTGNII